MTLKEKLMQELEQVSEAELAKVIEFVRSLTDGQHFRDDVQVLPEFHHDIILGSRTVRH